MPRKQTVTNDKNYIEHLARKGFEAYCRAKGGKTYDDKDIPSWEEIKKTSPDVIAGWIANAEAIIEAHDART